VPDMAFPSESGRDMNARTFLVDRSPVDPSIAAAFLA